MHNIDYFSYPVDVDRQKVNERLDDLVARIDWQEGCSGLYHPIRWLEKTVYQNDDEARNAIEKIDNGNYDQIAVKYYAYTEPKDAKMSELRKKAEEALDEYNHRERRLYSKTVTSAFIGCKKCGSKLAREFLASNNCPVCRNDLRPDHMIKAVNAAHNKWIRACGAVTAYRDKKGERKIMWLVKIEYHT